MVTTFKKIHYFTFLQTAKCSDTAGNSLKSEGFSTKTRDKQRLVPEWFFVSFSKIWKNTQKTLFVIEIIITFTNLITNVFDQNVFAEKSRGFEKQLTLNRKTKIWF